MRSRRAPRVTRDRTRATTSTIDFRVIYPTRTRARPAPARARAVRAIRERTHPSSIIRRHPRVTHPSIHPSTTLLRERRAAARSSRTLLARTATDRRRCVVCLTLVVTTGVARARADRMIGPGRGVTTSRASPMSPRLGHSSGSIARRGLDAWSRSVDRSIVGGGRAKGEGRRAGRMSEHTPRLARSPRPRSRHGRAWAHTTRARDRGDAGDIR